MKFILIPILFALLGCSSFETGERQTLKEYKALNKRVGSWRNLYDGNPRLAGVIVQQYPEGIISKKAYENRHPASIWYVFWDGDVNSVEYFPDGSIRMNSFWKQALKKGSSDWNDVDYSYGSDRNFLTHPDPRTLHP